VNIKDLEGISNEKLQFIVDNGDPEGQLHPLAVQVLQARAGTGTPQDLERPAEQGVPAGIARPPGLPVQATAAQLHADPKAAAERSMLPLPHHGVRQFAEDTTAGLAGGLYSGVPGLAAGLEAAGELGDALGTGGAHNIFPRPGQIRRAMDGSPLGSVVSSVVGAAVPLVGQTGLLGKTAKVVSDAFLAPAANIYQNLAGEAPGLTRTVVAGAGTGMAIGAGEAAIRRAPAVAKALGKVQSGQPVTDQVPPVDIGNELLIPGALGGVSSILPGSSSWATNPRTQRGQRAALFARDKASGAHEQEPLRSLMEGQAGIEQAKKIANESYQDQLPALEQPVLAQERRAIGELERDRDTFKAFAMRSRGVAADETSRAIMSKLEAQRTATHKTREADMQDLDERTARQLFDTSGFFGKTVELIGGFKSEGGHGALLPNGRALATAASELQDFLPQNGATMRDFRNAIKYTKSKAQSGTDEQRWPYEMLLGELKAHTKAVDPTGSGDSPGLYAQSNERFRTDTNRQERTKQIVFGGPEEAKVELSPQVEARGRRGLMQLGDGTASAIAKIPHREELIANGYGPEVEAMEGRLRDIEQMSYETQQWHDDAVAAVKADVKARLVDISRELQPQTDAILESKVAQEASKLRLSGLTRPLTEAALGATSHSPVYAGARAADAADKIGGRIAQPIASAIASHSPDASVLRSSIPGMMGIATEVSRGPASKSMIDGARKQRERFKNSIGSTSEYLKKRLFQ
jgi:hypothetical protein